MTSKTTFPVLLLLWAVAIGQLACGPPPANDDAQVRPESTAHSPSTAEYIPLARLLEPVEGPLLDPESGETGRMRVFQSMERRDGRIRTTRRINDDGWFVRHPDGSASPLPDAESSRGILKLTPRLRGELLFTSSDFSSRQVDLVAIGVESPRPGRVVFAWDHRTPGEPLRLGNQYVIELTAAEGVREYLVPVRRIPGWRGRIRAFGLRADRLDDEITVHYLRFISSGFVEALRSEPGRDGMHRGRLELNDESRSVHYAPAGTVLEARLHVPRGAFLELGFGLHPAARATVGSGVTFRVEADTSAGKTRVLFSGRLVPGEDESRRWNDQRLALDEFAGQDVTFRLVTEADSFPPATETGRHPDRFGDHAVWSSPAMVVRDSRFDPDRRNVILLLVDTLRPDHLSCYGSPRRTSPHLDRLASRGLTYSMARGQAPWTAASTGSLFTSLYPSRHGAERDRESLLSGCLTLAEVLADTGFHTKGFITNITVSALLNFDQGFDSYTYIRPEKRRPYAGSPVLFPRVFSWLEQNADKPFFLYIHTMDPHSPYVVGPPFSRVFDAGEQDDRQFDAATGKFRSRKLGGFVEEDLRYLDTLYDGEIALGDYYLGRLMAELRRLGLEENTAVIFTSDHGEEFLDHGDWGHAKTLYGELINVPLVVKLPAGGAGEPPAGGLCSHSPARLVDLFPTVLEILGVDLAAADSRGQVGRSLLGRRGAPVSLSPGALPLFAEANKGEHLLFSVQENNFKFIRRVSPLEQDELYDLEEDPRERRNVIDEHPELASRLAAWGESVWEKRETAGGRVAQDQETEQRLRALGYVE